MKVETTLRKLLFLRMATWLIPVDRETNRKRKELRRWIEERAQEQLEAAEVVLDAAGFGSFTIGRHEDDAYLPVEIDLGTEQMGLCQAMFARGVIWPNRLTEEQDDEIDELEQEVADWIEQDKAARDLRRLPKKRRRELLKEAEAEDNDDDDSGGRGST